MAAACNESMIYEFRIIISYALNTVGGVMGTGESADSRKIPKQSVAHPFQEKRFCRQRLEVVAVRENSI